MCNAEQRQITAWHGVNMKGWLSIREISYRWGISERRVNQYCLQGRIPGAERFGRSWAIPEDAERPFQLKRGPHLEIRETAKTGGRTENGNSGEKKK